MHEQNSVSEWAIHMITEGACIILYASNLPKDLWSVAIKTMAYLHNRSPACANNETILIECIWAKTPIYVGHLRNFGSPVSVAVPKEKRKKWGSRL